MEHDPDDGDPMGAPHRPGDDWHCKDDAEEWPLPGVPPDVVSLPRNRPRLAEVMGGFRDKATAALPDLPPEQAEARFVGWVHDPPVRRRLRAV